MLNGLYLGSHAVLLLILKIITFDFLSGRPAIRQTFHLVVFTFLPGGWLSFRLMRFSGAPWQVPRSGKCIALLTTL
ncbi:hypothetical protein [Brenneria goodwinii]|uniref:hypothetical protein n=1 Tax=Brenneria goodwinii TaxID=1109412 RepID=UPI0036EB876F